MGRKKKGQPKESSKPDQTEPQQPSTSTIQPSTTGQSSGTSDIQQMAQTAVEQPFQVHVGRGHGKKQPDSQKTEKPGQTSQQESTVQPVTTGQSSAKGGDQQIQHGGRGRGIPQQQAQQMVPPQQQPYQQPQGAWGPRPQQPTKNVPPQQQPYQQPQGAWGPRPQQPTKNVPPQQQPYQQPQGAWGPRPQQPTTYKEPERPQAKQQPQRPSQQEQAAGTSQQRQQAGRGKPQTPQQPQPEIETAQAGGDAQIVVQGVKRMKVTEQAAKPKREQGGGDAPAVKKKPAEAAPSDPLIEPQLMKVARKGGTVCKRRILVVTNHFPLTLGKITRALHYDVEITPDKPKKLFRQVMETFRLKYYRERYPAFDGNKNLYAARALFPGGSMSGTVKVIEDDREREFSVTIKFATEVDLSSLNDYFAQIGRQSMVNLDKPMQALQCIDIVLRSAPSVSCIPVGRSYFTMPVGRTITLGDGSELYNGFFQSAILGWKPFLNVDVAHKAFPMAMHMIEVINEFCRNPNPNNELYARDAEAVAKHVKQLKVSYQIPNMPSSRRVYRVNDIGQPPARATFNTDAGVSMTVQRYFEVEKRTKLRYPKWPTLWVGSRNRENKILLPCEFCTILPGQPVNKKMTDEQTRNMIRHAATPANVRLNKILNSVKTANYNLSPAVREFGISVSEKPEVVPARILQAPSLTYEGNRSVPVQKGVWRGGRFVRCVHLNKWTIICLDRRTKLDALNDLEKSLMNSGRNFGVDIPKAERDGRDFTYIDERDDRRLKASLTNYFQTSQRELIIVVVPTDRKFAYHLVKQASELVVGKLTQCVKSSTVFRLKPSTTDNLLLKINAKLNGVNHMLSPNDKPAFFKRPFVVMGADVTHPSPDATGIPSVAAVTCSYDANAFKYIFSWRLQGPKIEIIHDLETIVKEQLLYFREVNKGAKPERIFFFRDGVSDGQFSQVLTHELTAIRSACKKLNEDYQPKITFLVVQKRHHTRLFPQKDSDSEDKNLNVPAGTCVDEVITHPSALDFFLVSHASIQGVARPTKYRMLWDDADMTEDEIEHLTYYLCHLFARCNRSVSYPAPTYYAHLAAARAKVYIENERIDMNNLQRAQAAVEVRHNIIRDMPMFFV